MNGPDVAGAYLLVKPGPLVGPTGLTASGCLAEVAPGSWAIDWVNTRPCERERHASALGISAEALPEVVAWATKVFGAEFKWPNVFCNLAAAREFQRRFLPAGVRLIGLALPMDLVDEFLTLAAPSPQQPGYAPNGPTGAVFNAWGLLDDESMARQCARYAGRPETGTCADWWYPWTLREYDR